MRLWFPKSGRHVALVLHLTSGSVGGALVEMHKGAKPKILASVRRPYFTEGIPRTEDFAVKMFATLREVLAVLAKCGCGCDTAHVCFSSPWLETRMSSFKVEEPRGIMLDDRTLHRLVREREQMLGHEWQEKEDVEVFEMLITGVRLNGYEAAMPITKPTTDAEVSLLLSATPRALRLKIEDEILRAFGLKSGIHMAGYASAFSRVILNSFQTIHSALLVTIESETTDILLIRHSVPTTSVSLPFGSAFLARRVARKLKTSLALGYSYLSLYSREDFDSSMQQEVAELVKEGEDEWRETWQEAEATLTGGISLPHSVFLVDDATPGEVHRLLIAKVLPHAEVTILGEHNTFTDMLVDVAPGVTRDQALSLCIAHIAEDLF